MITGKELRELMKEDKISFRTPAPMDVSVPKTPHWLALEAIKQPQPCALKHVSWDEPSEGVNLTHMSQSGISQTFRGL